jgi:hypothetical protein
MADLSVQPVGAQVKPMQGMSLGEMMNFARGAQEYQKGGISLSLERQKEQERKAMTDFLSKPEHYQKDGRVDINKLNAEITKIAPLTGIEYISALTNLSGAQSESQQKGIALSVDQQKDLERKQMQIFLGKPENFQTNGRIDLDKLNSAVTKLAPLTGADYIEKFTTLGKSQTAAIEAKQKLTQDQRNMIGQRFGLLGRLGIQDKNAYLAEMDLLKKENPDNPDLHKLIDAYKTTWKDIPSGPQLPSMAIAGANTLLSVATQQEAFAPKAGTADTGAATFVTTTKPSMAGEAPTVSVSKEPLVTAQLPPGSLEKPTGEYDLNNNPIVNVFGPDGRFLGRRAVTTTPSAADLPGGSRLRPVATREITTEITPVTQLPPGETQQTRDAAQKIRLDASDAMRRLPEQINNSNEIIRIADEATTGKGAKFLSNLTGNYALFNKVGIGGKDATALQELGHYMAQQTASLAASSNLSATDASRGIAGEMAGNIEWTPEAIKKTARVNRALSTATKLFGEGVENAFKQTNNIFSARDFQNKWSKTVDIPTMRLYDAYLNGDTDGIKEIVNQVGGPNSEGYKKLVKKLEQINKLVEGK